MVPSVRSLTETILRGETDTRLWATWRVLIPFGLFVLATAGASVTALVVPFDSLPSELAVSGLTVAVLTAGVLLVSARYLDRRSPSDYGFHRDRTWWLDLAAGTVLGVVLTGLLFLASYGLGSVRIDDVLSAGTGPLLAALVLTIVGTGFWATVEEVVFRGIVVPNAAEGLAGRGLGRSAALVGGVVVSTTVFAVPHLSFGAVPGGVPPALLVLSWTMSGLLYGLAYLLTGSLALPVGLHFASNAAVNVLFFGGLDDATAAVPALVRVEVLSSGAWYPIHGLLDSLITIVGLAAVVGWVYWTRGTVSLDEPADRWRLQS
ncbi:CPBP family glutamic-type intramembrane protease [Halopiger djelfimassiliensis]|uniref:CPBP family glutamic-type intramembrane protease n=1 Tax=Halopiger djelfimassiliensis TaxID=1293047 RepID=UPI000677A0BF|nr:CPBP family glutamic-type intramembrane protease [Halopiger djelfimassiliensis]